MVVLLLRASALPGWAYGPVITGSVGPGQSERDAFGAEFAGIGHEEGDR
ncbi:hypothetical protein [Streptomyces sp. NPDC054874]